MVVHAGGLANEQRVEFGQTRIVLFLDQFDIDAQLLARFNETLQGL